MTPQQKANIGRGVKEAVRRKRLSVAMKASWVERRKRKAQAANNVKENIDVDGLVDVAIKLLGYDELAQLLKKAIKSEMKKWLA